MWKKIGLAVLGPVIGCVLGVVLSMAYLGRTMATGMFMLQEKEILNIGEAAEDAYYNEPNEVAVWALENYIKTLNELKEERKPAKVKNPYFILTPDIDLLFAHARSGKIYKQMGNDEKSQYHFEQAISHSKNTRLKSLNTQEDCLKMLDAIDKSHIKRSE
jgi:L-ribulose-5-phosphate 3-epimerase UlaE